MKSTKCIADQLIARQAIDDGLFYVALQTVCQAGRYAVVKRNKYKGLTYEERLLLSPIYDDISVLDNRIAVVLVEGLKAVYLLAEHRLITDFDYSEIALADNDAYLLLTTPSNKLGVLDVKRQSWAALPAYDEISNNLSSEYVWVRNGPFYHFVNFHTGNYYGMPGLIMAYDTLSGMFGMNDSHKVSCYRENGIADTESFRNAVIQHGGHLVLQNTRRRIEHIVDIYGNILN